MIEIGAGEFARRLKRLVIDQKGLVAFFLGAGASISSNIPGAATLARKWARQLHHDATGGIITFDEWRASSLA